MEVVTPNSKQKPPLPMRQERKHRLDEEKKQIKRRHHSTPPQRRSGRLKLAAENEGVHIHVNLDGSGQVLLSSASPKQITVWVSLGRLTRRARRSLEVTTMPKPLLPIAECNGTDEDADIERSCSEEDHGEHPSTVEDLESFSF